MKLSLAIGLLAALFVSGVSHAQDSLRIGYVDLRSVISESKAGKQFRAQLEKYVKDKQATIKKEEEKLVALKKSFEKEALTLSDAQKLEKQKTFQDKVQALRKMAEDADRDLRQKDGDFTNKALATVREVIAEVAKEEKVNLVLNHNEVLYGDGAMNLTAKVTAKYNSRTAK